MYQVPSKYKSILDNGNIQVRWYGRITMKDATLKDFDNSHISEGTGTLIKRCSDASKIEIGTAYTSELSLQFKNLNVDRYKLYEGVIGIWARVDHYAQIVTWEDAGDFTWEDMGDLKWSELGVKPISYIFPMGLYIIKEAMRTANDIKIVAYDFMILFEEDLPNPMPSGRKIPYDWLKAACTACGVTLGITRAELLRWPNGNRLLGFSNADEKVKTWRDVVMEVAETMGANAMMDREGKLILRRYEKYPVDGVSAGFRYSSDFSDYQSFYTGIYLNYKDGNVQDYETNAASTAEDTGLSFDLGYQPFMQISDDGARSRAMKEIIDGQKDLTAMPFKVNMPFNPAYDLMDVLKFYENQATMTDVAPITAITFRIGDKMDISCGGENPALQEAKSKETKALESASGSSYNNDFWMVTDEAPEENQVIVPADTATKIGEALFYAKESLSMFQVAYTATYNLFKTTMVEVEVFVDETSVYKTQENQWPGENRVTVTTGCEVQGVGSHKVEIYVTVTESTLDVGGGGVLTELNMTSNGIRIAADDGVYGYSKVTALIEDGMGYYAGVVDVTPQTEPGVFETELDFSEMIFESDILVHEYMGPQQVSDYDGEYVTIEGTRGVELIIHDYSYTGTAGTIDEGYLSVCEVPTNNYSLLVEVDAYDSAWPDVFSLFDQSGLGMAYSSQNNGQFVKQLDGSWYGEKRSNTSSMWSIPIPTGYRYLSIDIESSGNSGQYNLSTMLLRDAYGVTGYYEGNLAGENLKTVRFVQYSGTLDSLNHQEGVDLHTSSIYTLTRQTVTVDISSIDKDMYVGWHRCDNSTRIYSINATM